MSRELTPIEEAQAFKKGRFMQYRGSNMAPMIRPGDYVLIMPGDRYTGEGHYAMDICGGITIHTLSSDFRGGLHLNSGPTSLMPGRDVPLEWANSVILGRVAGVMNLVAPHLIG